MKHGVMVVVSVVVILVAAVGVFSLLLKGKGIDTFSEGVSEFTKSSEMQFTGNPDELANSTDPVEKGFFLSGGQCEGEGSKELTHVPMDPNDIGVIVPHGLMVTTHVTPVDHQYYYQTNPSAPKDTYPVYAPADGMVVGVEHHEEGDERWRIVIMYSCTFFSYYDLLTDFAPELQAQLPADWGPNNQGNIRIPVKAGDVIGSVGGQSLDFAVWDTTVSLPGLLYSTAYNNAEPWKLHTVSPLAYFSDDVVAQLRPKYVGDSSDPDGKLDYDIAGKAIGNWFAEGTNGYLGSTQFGGGSEGYYQGHLTLAYDNVDTSALTVSIGDFEGRPRQFTVSGEALDFADVDVSSGVVKYQLAERHFLDARGVGWNGSVFTESVQLVPGTVVGTLLIQVLPEDQLRVEYVSGKTPDQVSEFSEHAKVYDRGQNATMARSNTAT